MMHLLCAIGLHRWAEWKYEVDSQCKQISVCGRCKSMQPVATREAHEWQDWHYVADGACDQQRVCQRCGAKDNRVEHSWGQEEGIGSDSETETLGKWCETDMAERTTTYTTYEKSCTRCGKSEKRTERDVSEREIW